MSLLDQVLAQIYQFDPFILTLFLSVISMLAFLVYQYRRDSGSTALENANLVKAFLGKKKSHEVERTLAESIPISRVAEIYNMTDTKMKGDALEDLTRDIYQFLGYKAWTVRELKDQGKLPWLTGVDQGGDVIAELYNDQKEIVERLMIQCKAYKNLDDESGNKAVHQAHFAQKYYGEKMGVTFDKAILLTTSHRMSKPAMDAAQTAGVEIIDNDPTLDHNRIPKSKLIALIKKANAKLYQRSLKVS
jgi:hypothetical protein